MSLSRFSLPAVAITISLLSACSRMPPPDAEPSATATIGGGSPAEAVPSVLPPAIPTEAPAETPPAVEAPPERPVASAPPVLALMGEAEASRQSGQLDTAAASLERAIRIQPRNPLLWQQLAKIRLQQQQPQLAEDLAKKSNILAVGNRSVLQANWALIAEARRLKGDIEGARDAEAKRSH